MEQKPLSYSPQIMRVTERIKERGEGGIEKKNKELMEEKFLT